MATPSAIGKNEESNTAGRVDNKGMEGIAISPDGKTLYGIMQSPLLQDNALDSKGKKLGTDLRIVKVDLTTNATQEFIYQLADKGNTVSEIVAINDHEFLVDERDGSGGSLSSVKQIYKIDLNGATDISNVASLPATGTNGATAVSKTSFLNLLNPAYGLASTIPEKIEGMALGGYLSNGQILLLLANDNDFNTSATGTADCSTGATPTAGSTCSFSVTNNFYAFGIDPTDLSYTPQSVSSVPLPASLPMLLSGFGLLGGVARLCRQKK